MGHLITCREPSGCNAGVHGASCHLRVILGLGFGLVITCIAHLVCQAHVHEALWGSICAAGAPHTTFPMCSPINGWLLHTS